MPAWMRPDRSNVLISPGYVWKGVSIEQVEPINLQISDRVMSFLMTRAEKESRPFRFRRIKNIEFEYSGFGPDEFVKECEETLVTPLK